ncbi:MAG TPA: hypothetical protein GX522_05095 [Firmicutes bacterium]|nr:hypothetical protein [Bacillota bacterium]
MKRGLIISLTLILILSTSVLAAQPPTDVPKTHWAYQAILKVLDSGLMEGYPDGSFRGQQSVDRYEMAMFVARLIDRLEEIEKDYDTKLQNMIIASEPGIVVKEIKTEPEVIVKEVPTESPMVKEILSLVSQLQVEFELELREISDRYYNIKLDYGKLEEALQNLESVQQHLSKRIDYQQGEIDELRKRTSVMDETRKEVDSLQKEVNTLREEVANQSKTIKSLFVALGVMGVVVLLVGLK